jgi:Asp-tRNA(Asn)/Glu-tRNA(Gln) amidotransferase A subunit family amidase
MALDSVKAARAAFTTGAVSAEEIARGFLDRIARDNPVINGYREVLSGGALADARAADARRKAGQDAGPLAGVCLAIKENIDCPPAAASAGMGWLRDRRPGFPAPVVARLRVLGATILGTTISDPGAFDVRTPDVSHPADPALSVGGSSGGSAAVLAAGLAHGALGTDTGGSVRIPAALCGLAGLKPVWGPGALQGVWPLVPSLDHVGPLARTLDDLDAIWAAMTPDSGLTAGVTIRRLGYDPAWVAECDAGVQAAFRRGLQHLTDLGVDMRQVRLPSLDQVSEMHRTIFCTETAAWYRANVAPGTALPAAAVASLRHADTIGQGAYLAACDLRRAMTDQVDAILTDCDLILTPTVPVMQAPKAAMTLPVAGQKMDFTYALIRLTCLFNHTGHPALAFPFGGASLQATGRKADNVVRMVTQIMA